MMIRFSSVLFTLLSFNLVICQRIKLRDIEVLTFFKDRFTNGKRVEPIPQLKCVGNSYMCYNFSPSAVQCNNKGFDGVDVQWECKAELDKRIRFGVLKVICEGFEYPNDPFVLEGSCGLEYSLEYAAKAVKHYNDYYHKDLYETSKLSNFLSLAIILIIILAVYKSCLKTRENEPRNDFNATYAQIINQSESINSNENIYPPPPPPYGFNPTYSATNPPPSGFKPEVIDHNTNEPTASGTNNEASTTSGWSSYITGASVGNIRSYLFSRTNDINNWQEASSCRRTESPPPAYESDNNSSTVTSIGFATTSRR